MPSAKADGASIMPARSDRVASNGASGCLRLIVTVIGSSTVTLSTAVSSLLRLESGSVIERSMFALTASASNFEPSWKVTPSRSLKVSFVWSSLYDQEVASCGVNSSFGVMSMSLSQSEVKTMRPT